MIADLFDITEDDARGLCELAAHDLAMARHFRECAEAAEDGELKTQFGRAYRGMARSYRQTLAMKLRLKRALTEDDRARAADLRQAAEAGREAAARERRNACDRHRMAVSGEMERLVWSEYEPDDANEVFRDVFDDLVAMADAPDFLDTPVEALVRELSRTFGLGEFATPEAPDDPDEPALPAPAAPALRAPEAPVPETRPGHDGEPLDFDAAPPPAPLATPDRSPDGPAAAEAGPSSPPPDAPPDPPPRPPEPYVPPWEKLRPGQVWPGSSGW